jgi:hypothetical protein
VGLFAVAVVACSRTAETPPAGGVICTMEARAGLNVEIFDSVSGAPAADGARVLAVAPAIRDSATGSGNSSTVSLAYERAGTYTVTVSRSGYRTWSRLNVEVTRDQCHVIPVRLTARLQR